MKRLWQLYWRARWWVCFKLGSHVHPWFFTRVSYRYTHTVTAPPSSVIRFRYIDEAIE